MDRRRYGRCTTPGVASATQIVRYATAEDLPDILALMKRDPRQAPIERGLLAGSGERDRHLLVLDDVHGTAVAAALVTIAQRRGHLLMLAVSPDADEAHALEQRMFAVVEALCDAYGVKTVDVPARHAA